MPLEIVGNIAKENTWRWWIRFVPKDPTAFAVRFDRWLTLWLFRPLCSIRAPSQGARVPILMYHSVSGDAEEEVAPYYRIATSKRRFSEQMQWLRELGYKGLSLEEALPIAANPKNGQRLIALTFDDGFRDFYTAAWPILQEHSFTATMYLPTGLIDQQRKSWRGKECLTWTEVRELRTRGIRFGSHTVNHPQLSELSWEEIERETALSKTQIEQEIGEKVTTMAYPYAFPQERSSFVTRLGALLRRQEYRSCVTTVAGRSQLRGDPFFLRRLPINSADDKALFVAKLNGAYDWMAPVQGSWRHVKGGLSRRFGQRRLTHA